MKDINLNRRSVLGLGGIGLLSAAGLPTASADFTRATGHTVYTGWGSTIYAIDVDTGEQSWAFTKPSGTVYSSPTVVSGTVYAGSYDGTLYAVNAEYGTEEWRFEAPDDMVWSSPTVVGGRVFIGSIDGSVYAVNAATGDLEWEISGLSNSIYSSITVVEDLGFVGTYEGSVYAFDPETGEQEWVFDDPTNSIYASPTISNGTVFVPAYDETLYAIDAESGDSEWTFDGFDDIVWSSPTVAGGIVYVGGVDGVMYALDEESGDVVWTFEEPSGWLAASPTVDDGTVYIAWGDEYEGDHLIGTLYALDAATGSQQWAFTDAKGYVWSSPTVADDTVYAGSGTLFAINADTGDPYWEVEYAGGHSSPTVVADPENGHSIDSRVRLGTLGHHHDVADTEPVGSDTDAFRIGQVVSVDSINFMVDNSVYRGLIRELLYDQGVQSHPETGEMIPWLFESWEVDQSEATLNVTVRDGVTWHDGEPLTVDDVAFTAEYAADKQPHNLPSEKFEEVTSIETDEDAKSVRFHFGTLNVETVERILHSTILPKHVWNDVDNPIEHEPFKEDGTVIGSGGYVLEDAFTDEYLYRVKPRSDGYPLPETVDFVENDAPFAEPVEVVHPDDPDDALLSGKIDIRLSGVNTVTALELEDDDTSPINVQQNLNDGYQIIGYNGNRFPFDDVAFRQFLTLAWDTDYHIEEVEHGFGAIPGDVPAPPQFDDYRPDEDEFDPQRYAIPRDDEGAIDLTTLRTYLEDHDEAKYDYSFEDTDDGSLLYVDDEPFTEARDGTDGDGTGPLTLYTSGDPNDQASFEHWIDILQHAGVPAELEVMHFNDVVGQVYGEGDFDTYQIGWSNLSPKITYLQTQFSSDGVFNVYGYSGADDLLENAQTTFDEATRQDLVADALVQIYRDAPINVINHRYRFDAVTEPWTGLVAGQGGVTNSFSWLNVQVATGAEVYADAEGIVDSDGLQTAVQDWRDGDIETEVLIDVVEAWRTEEKVD